MPYGLYVSAAGANAQNHRLQVLSNNLANVQTAGYKPQQAIMQARFAELMAPWGLKIEHVEGDLGAASGIKIMRSVIAKGLEALLVECLLGARRYGIDEAVLTSFGRFMDSRPFRDMANFLVVTDVIHAERRSHEARMSVDALEEAGVDAIMTRATSERLEWVTNLDTKALLGGVVPVHYAEAIEAIEKQLKTKPSA